MKILHVIDSGGFYGAEVMLVNLVEEQVRQGQDPVIASVGDPGIGEKALETEASNRNLPLEIFRMRPGLNLVGAQSLMRFFREGKFDLIHSHGYKGNILLAPFPGRFKRKPMLSTLHGWTSTKGSGFTRMRVYEWLDALSLRFVDGIVLVNRGMLDNPGVARLPREKIFFVDNGIAPLPLRLPPPDPDIEEFCRNGSVIIAIGRYAKEKGFDLLIDAFTLLGRKIDNLRLLLIGEGGCRREYEGLIREHDLRDRVLLAGYRPEAWRYFSLAHVFVISSWTEGLPITLLEAMRGRIPVVATRVGGIPEVLRQGRGGLLVAPGDSRALARAIENCLLDSAQAAARVESSYRCFQNNYSSRVMAEKYSAIYARIVS